MFLRSKLVLKKKCRSSHVYTLSFMYMQYRYMFMSTYLYTFTYMYACVCISIYTYIYVYTYLRVYVCAFIYTYIHIYCTCIESVLQGTQKSSQDSALQPFDMPQIEYQTLVWLLRMSTACTPDPTWGDNFESSKLRARTSLLPRFSEKRRSSFELWALKQHLKMSPQVGSAVL